ncbi:Hypothetical protein A7982_01916 [Minicystis rosea]|nr:Hypothetical protein A7982_01916 [Minicystis rosea]
MRLVVLIRGRRGGDMSEAIPSELRVVESCGGRLEESFTGVFSMFIPKAAVQRGFGDTARALERRAERGDDA